MPHLSRLASHLRAWGPAAAWAAVLFFLSSQSLVGYGGLWRQIPDEVLHLGAYAVLGATLAHARFHGGRRVPHGAMVLLGTLYGLSDEWHQSFVPGRSPSLGDWVADVAGVVSGYGLCWIFLTGLASRRDAENRGAT